MKSTRRNLFGLGAGLAVTGLSAGEAGAAGPAAPQLLFTLAPTLLPVHGRAEKFPVRRVYCIGRNYPEHAKEMGSDPRSEPPFFFQKASDDVQIVPVGAPVDNPYPPLTKSYHHELELVAVLKSGGRNIPAASALDHVYGYAVGLDMTRRDLQQVMKDQRKPWEIGKSFDHAGPVGPIFPAAGLGHLTKGRITLTVNGTIRQDDDLASMIWSVAEQIAELSLSSELAAGDMIFSGTPAGVGAVVKGDVLVGHIDGLPDLAIRIV